MIDGFSLYDIIVIKDGLNEGKLCLINRIDGYSKEIEIVELFGEGLITLHDGLHPVAWIEMDRVEILTKDN